MSCQPDLVMLSQIPVCGKIRSKQSVIKSYQASVQSENKSDGDLRVKRGRHGNNKTCLCFREGQLGHLLKIYKKEEMLNND